MDTEEQPFDVEASEFERKAATLLAAVEARCAYMRRESRLAIEAYVLCGGRAAPRRARNRTEPGKREAGEAPGLGLGDLERYVPYWQSLVPADPALRAALARLLSARYAFVKQRTRRMRGALGLNHADVRRCYEQMYGAPFDSLFTEAAPGEKRAEPVAPQESALRKAAAALEWVMLPSGGTLYCKGDEDSSLYIIISGRLRVTLGQEATGEQIIAELGRGEMVGLTEVLTGEPRADNAYAMRDCELVRLPVPALRALGRQFPELWENLSSVLAGRLRVHLARPSHAVNTLRAFAVLPAEPHTGVVDFRRRFVSALAEHGATLCVDSGLVDERLGEGMSTLGEDALEQSRLLAWLAELEAEQRYIVYAGDAPASAWSDRCVRQADRVLIVVDPAGNAGAAAETARHVREVDPQAEVELVLLQASDCVQPAGTGRALDGGQFIRHHQLRIGVDGDLQRLVRRMTGKALGLVLGGGGARGWAHVGVWRALREAGVEVDLLGGTSMGAVIGGCLAMGLDEDGVREMARRFSAPTRLFDVTLPMVSFLSSGKATEVLRSIYGGIEIEDLWRPFFSVASNLTRATQVVFTAGPLWSAVRASTAIPGIFAPMLHEGDVLVDGAVLNNLPSDVMETFSGGGPIVAVNVFPDVDIAKEYQFDPSVSGWEVLLKQLNPLSDSPRVPWIFETLIRTMSLNDVHQARAKRSLADLYIRPPVERFNILDFAAYDEIIEIGYETAQREIERWLAGDASSEEPPAPAQEHARADAAQPLEGGAASKSDALKGVLGALESVLRDVL